MKATTLLERQHRNLQQLCEAVERGTPSMRESLLPQLAGDVIAHFAVEAELLYPAIGDALGGVGPSGTGRAWEAEGHARCGQAVEALELLLQATCDGIAFEGAIRDLHAIIELHAQEEEAGLFPRLEVALEAAASRDLARAMMTLYHAKVEAGYTRATRATDPRVPRLSEVDADRVRAGARRLP
jgi:hypothetical protein